MSRYKQLGPNPMLPVVTPDGDVWDVRYSENMAGGIIEIRGGKPRIADEFADKGYRFLSDYYAEEPDAEIRENGFGVYMQRAEAVRLGQVRREANAEGRAVIPPMPKEWLPAAVVDMQEGRAGAKAWQPPTRGEDKPKRGRPRAS